MKVLFSPIGSTDPITGCKDGGMLHICRVYHPDKVYLYLSKEMCIYHDLDDRYCKAIRLLEKECDWKCEIEVIRDDEMENVQLFDAFINLFESIIDRIRKEDNAEQVLVNVSSGTPAMKSSLQMISLLWNDVIAVQVSTPVKSSNKIHEDKERYDLEMQWEFNEDRLEDFENRCIISSGKRLLDRIKRENIEKYILVYDYEAARMLADTLSEQPGEQFVNGLDVAIARNKQNLIYVNRYRKEFGFENWFPIVQEREMKEFEYLLAMQIKLQRKQYVDFMRDITPIFFSLSEKVLEKYCGLRFADIGEEKDGVWNLDIGKLNKLKVRPQLYWNNHTNISAYTILTIMKQLCMDKVVLDLMRNIRKAEREVRNLAAHEIIGVTYEWIVKKVKLTPQEIMENMFDLAECAGLKVSGQNRKIYDRMNQDLIGFLHA